jgi:hypothetical protein
MKRFALVAFSVAATVAMAAAPAFAKGDGVPILAKAVITGPGLGRPIVVSGDLFAFGEGQQNTASGLAEGLIAASGLGAGPEEGWYELPPDTTTLGPAYEVNYFIEGEEQFGTTVPLHQSIYPYAAGRPFVYTAPGQRFFGSKIGEWWSASPSLRTWLVSHGLPAAPVAVPAPAQPRSVPELPVADAFPWAVVFVATALLAMVVTAALAGRRRALARVGRGA